MKGEETMNYEELIRQAEALTADCPFVMSNLANIAALIWQEIPQINWAGFYELRKEGLVLGPFQGKPACILIPVGRGVCGTAVRDDRIQCVFNVHDFPGHIACDGASSAEIVIPLHVNGKIWGVLDIDSPTKGRFSEADEKGLQKLSLVIEAFLAKGERPAH